MWFLLFLIFVMSDEVTMRRSKLKFGIIRRGGGERADWNMV